MRLLMELDRCPGIRRQGRRISREAVRAIIPDGDLLLLVHAKCDGDYKFPGGGVKRGEDHTAALIREVNEETGATLRENLVEYGMVIEYDRPTEKGFDLFVMTSYYYVCQVEPEIGPPHLERYESELGFDPEWVSITEALAANQSLLQQSSKKRERWVKRETAVLRLLLKEQKGAG